MANGSILWANYWTHLIRWTTTRRRPGPINPLDQAARGFRSASRRVNEAIAVVQEPGMPLEVLARFTRQAPLQALAVAFLVGVLVTGRR